MDKKMILHIAEAPGGVERYLVALLTKLKENDEFEHVLVCSDSYEDRKFKGLVRNIEHVSTMHNAINAKEDIESIRVVRRLIKKYRPDVVYCHSSKAGAIGRAADMGVKNRLIYNAHGWSFNMKGASARKIRFYTMIEKMLACVTDEIVCISEHEKRSALEHGICKADKLRVIQNGIDFEEYSNLEPKGRKELGIPEGAFVIGTIGRLTRQKSPDVFVKMAAEVKKHIPEAFFLMIGDGLQRSETEAAIKAAGLEERFQITGWVDKPLDYAGCFDVAVLLSRWEGFGLVLPEYMLMEKAIVATRVDAIPEILGDAGLLVDSEDDKAAAESVIRLYEDEKLRRQVIEAGRKRVKRFDVQRTADEHRALFR